MGYFSTGSEGADYEVHYCWRCLHRPHHDSPAGCPVTYRPLTHIEPYIPAVFAILFLIIGIYSVSTAAEKAPPAPPHPALTVPGNPGSS